MRVTQICYWYCNVIVFACFKCRVTIFDVITSFSSGYIVGVGRVRTVTRATVTMTSQLGVLYDVTAGVLCT